MLQRTDVKLYSETFEVVNPPTTADIPTITFKRLAHQAAYMTPSAKAGLAAQLVHEELKVMKPTRLIASMATGASSSNLARALRATPAERIALVTNQVTLGELAVKVDNAQQLLDMVMPAVKPRFTVEEMLAAYNALTCAERVAFAREIGVVRCWQPRQRHHAY